MIQFRDGKERIVCDHCGKMMTYYRSCAFRAKHTKKWESRSPGRRGYPIAITEMNPRTKQGNAYLGEAATHFCKVECATKFRHTKYRSETLSAHS